MTSRVVYTALFGSTEALLEQEVAQSSALRFVCFTDNPSLTSTSWDIVLVEPLFAADPRASQRDIKIRGHRELDPYDEWLYLDNTVRLKVAPEAILDEWLSDADWAAISHDAHNTLWEEFELNLEKNKDTPTRLNEQLHDYSSHYRSVLDEHPIWNGLFARRRNAAVAAFTTRWFDHVLRYSSRDQLSVLVALSQSDIRLNRIDAKVRNSRWHDWPHRVGETPASKKTRHAKSAGLRPLADELAAVRAQLSEMESALAEAHATMTRLRDRQLFGLRGLARRWSEARVERRRERKRAKKRR